MTAAQERHILQALTQLQSWDDQITDTGGDEDREGRAALAQIRRAISHLQKARNLNPARGKTHSDALQQIADLPSRFGHFSGADAATEAVRIAKEALGTK